MNEIALLRSSFIMLVIYLHYAMLANTLSLDKPDLLVDYQICIDIYDHFKVLTEIRLLRLILRLILQINDNAWILVN